jgi:hypothetical protein
MTITERPVDNGVNVRALLGVRVPPTYVAASLSPARSSS